MIFLYGSMDSFRITREKKNGFSVKSSLCLGADQGETIQYPISAVLQTRKFFLFFFLSKIDMKNLTRTSCFSPPELTLLYCLFGCFSQFDLVKSTNPANIYILVEIPQISLSLYFPTGLFAFLEETCPSLSDCV